MNAALRINIWNTGDDTFGETKSGKKARKNIDSFGLRILIRNPLAAICHGLFIGPGELIFKEPVSRHIDQARYIR